MAIFRGPGGAGDATADATNAASIAEGFADDSAASAAAAEDSAVAAAAAGSASTASTQATNAGNSATAAASSASAASTSATNAAASASTATTQATNASTSASNASTSETNAAASESTATTQATNASTSATNAAASASTATTQATNAATSASNAASAQTAAEAALDSFDDRYLGPKTSDPALDNDGNALLTGALYFNSVSNIMKVYDGAAWITVAITSAGLLAASNNLSDLTNTATARQNLDLEVGVDVQAYDATILKSADIGVTVQGYDATIVVDADIGVSVQAYDADTAKTDVAQTFTVSQRGTVTTDNDGSFDLSVTNNFQCTPSGIFTLTFTNRTAGQSGFILLINTGAHTVSAHADTEVSTTALATISAAGTYLLSYFATSTNVYVVNSGALA